jgi:hypothetical protein
VKSLALVLVLALLGGCRATTQQTVQPSEQQPSSFSLFMRSLAGPGPGLAAHDPRSGQLFDQIPNWDDAAQKRCCSALSRNDFIKMRCDTDQPLEGRTNRC